MEVSMVSIAVSIIFLIVIRVALKLVNKFWLRPKSVEKLLKEQGLSGNPYRFFYGDMIESEKMREEAISKPMTLSDDIAPRVLPYHHHMVKKYGKNSFMWFGTKPRLILMDPTLIKEVLTRPNEFHKPKGDVIANILVGGLFTCEGEKWARHKKLINPAFHSEKLKNMALEISSSCGDLIKKWEALVSAKGSCEVDAGSYMDDLSSDIMSKALLGRTYEEGRKIFKLRNILMDQAFKVMPLLIYPGWRFFPAESIRTLKAVHKGVKDLLQEMIINRRKELKLGQVNHNGNLLSLLAEEGGTDFRMEEAIDECKLFHFVGSESNSRALIWALFTLCKHQKWQARAREEVLQVFGNQMPNFDGLHKLKIVTMILYETLRLYPITGMIHRGISKETKLGNMTLPAWIQMTIPITLLNHSSDIWGEDAKEFKPERFSEGISDFKNQSTFLAFAAGPRKCIGQNLAMITLKMVIATILQHFSLELAPSYLHAPKHSFFLVPQHGMQIILHKL